MYAEDLAVNNANGFDDLLSFSYFKLTNTHRGLDRFTLRQQAAPDISNAARRKMVPDVFGKTDVTDTLNTLIIIIFLSPESPVASLLHIPAKCSFFSLS